jgi:hypothetical protein
MPHVQCQLLAHTRPEVGIGHARSTPATGTGAIDTGYTLTHDRHRLLAHARSRAATGTRTTDIGYTLTRYRHRLQACSRPTPAQAQAQAQALSTSARRSRAIGVGRTYDRCRLLLPHVRPTPATHSRATDFGYTLTRDRCRLQPRSRPTPATGTRAIDFGYTLTWDRCRLRARLRPTSAIGLLAHGQSTSATRSRAVDVSVGVGLRRDRCRLRAHVQSTWLTLDRPTWLTHERFRLQAQVVLEAYGQAWVVCYLAYAE